jgi:hypothetical protein
MPSCLGSSTFWTLKIETLQPFETLGTAHSATELYIPGYLNIESRFELSSSGIYHVSFNLIASLVSFLQGQPSLLVIRILNSTNYCTWHVLLRHKPQNIYPDCQKISYSLQYGGDVYVAMSKEPLAGKSMVFSPSGLQVVIEQSER